MVAAESIEAEDTNGQIAWFELNDSTVSKISPDRAVTEEAYLLFYGRSHTIREQDAKLLAYAKSQSFELDTIANSADQIVDKQYSSYEKRHSSGWGDDMCIEDPSRPRGPSRTPGVPESLSAKRKRGNHGSQPRAAQRARHNHMVDVTNDSKPGDYLEPNVDLFTCPICTKSCREFEELAGHYAEAHPNSTSVFGFPG